MVNPALLAVAHPFLMLSLTAAIIRYRRSWFAFSLEGLFVLPSKRVCKTHGSRMSGDRCEGPSSRRVTISLRSRSLRDVPAILGVFVLVSLLSLSGTLKHVGQTLLTYSFAVAMLHRCCKSVREYRDSITQAAVSEGFQLLQLMRATLPWTASLLENNCNML